MDRRDFLASSAVGAFAVTLNWPVPALAEGDDALLESFRTPGPEARPHTWWHWMNGNVTADGITRDLEALARVGVGGVQMFDVGCGIPQGPAVTLGQRPRIQDAVTSKRNASFMSTMGISPANPRGENTGAALMLFVGAM